MTKSPARGNFISEWFGQRIYPQVRLNDRAISGQNWGNCPFISTVKRERSRCIKNENAFGVCTISSVSGQQSRDWLVCPYRVIDSDIVKTGCETIFGVGSSVTPIPISILGSPAGRGVLDESLKHGPSFIFFQDKLGGEISINGTPASPEVSFDVTVVELSSHRGGIKVGRYGFIEIQTMDFHGTYKHAVSNLRDAHRLHGKKFSKALRENQSWMSDNVEGPNLANVFKRTFYQTLLKFELSKEGAAGGTVLALPRSVWESWQSFLGQPAVEKVNGSEFRLVGSNISQDFHGTNAWIFVFEIDATSALPISPIVVSARIRVSATDLIEHAFVTVPRNMLHWATKEDALLERIRSRIRWALPSLVVQ